MAVRFKDYSEDVSSQLDANVTRALTALGKEAVGLIVDQMQSGYGKPIRKTGDLMRDVHDGNLNIENQTIDVGNSLEYGPHVHEGTAKMAGRPYIKDAILKNKSKLQDVIEKYLSTGF